MRSLILLEFAVRAVELHALPLLAGFDTEEEASHQEIPTPRARQFAPPSPHQHLVLGLVQDIFGLDGRFSMLPAHCGNYTSKTSPVRCTAETQPLTATVDLSSPLGLYILTVLKSATFGRMHV